MYHEKLTQKDVERLQEEIDHRKLVVRKEAIEAVKEARAQGDLSENLNITQRKGTRIRMRAGSAIWRECSRRQLSWKIIPRLTR